MGEVFTLGAIICAVLAGINLAFVREKDIIFPWLRKLMKVVFTVLVLSTVSCDIIAAAEFPDYDGWFFPFVMMCVAALVVAVLGYAMVAPRKIHNLLYGATMGGCVTRTDDKLSTAVYWVCWIVFFGLLISGAFEGIIYLPFVITISAIAAIASFFVTYIVVSLVMFIGKCLLDYWRWLTK